MAVDELITALSGSGFSSFELYSEEIIEDSVSFRANHFYSLGRRERQGYGIRVIKDGRIGFMSGTEVDLLTREIRTIRPTTTTRIRFPGPDRYEEVDSFHDTVSGWPVDKLIQFGKRMIEALADLEPRMKLEVAVTRRMIRYMIKNSGGLDQSYDQLIAYLWVEGQLVYDHHIRYIYDFVNISEGQEPDYGGVRRYFGMIIRNLKREVRTPPGSYPVIIMPIPLSTIITGITVGINGKSLDRGYSPLTDKIGKKVVSEKVTVYDDGLRPFGFRSGPFDGEGVARKKRVIFDKGVFKNFLFDLETGAKRGLPSTGNAQRSYSSLPSPGPNNLVMEPGHGDLDQTISGIDRGIIVCGVVGGGHGNIYAGDFSVKLDLGFLIEKGEIRGRLTETMMAGNIYNVLLNVIEIGDYQKDLGGEYLPWILTSELNFTAS